MNDETVNRETTASAVVSSAGDLEAFREFLTDVRMRATYELTEYICKWYPEDDPNRPDPADVNEDVRETLGPFFNEIRHRIEGPECPLVIWQTPNTGRKCKLIEGHSGACVPW